MKNISACIMAVLMMTACGNVKKTATTTMSAEIVGPDFSADSALIYCQQQCDFGPRTMNSEAHERCAEWMPFLKRIKMI